MSLQTSLSLAGKVAIVTGSGKENGIGAGIAMTLARAGARVVINHVSDTTGPRAAEVVSRIEAAAGKGAAVVVQADVSTPEGAKGLVDEALKALEVDHVDILVNNAVWYWPTPALEVSKDVLEKIFAVSLFGPLYMMQAAVPHMPRGGRIINIGSVASKLGTFHVPLYVTVKAALDALTFAMADEIGRNGKGITINVVAPGPVPTDMLDPATPHGKALADELLSLTRAEERLSSVDDVADTVLLLTSEKARWITGQFVSASGGITGN